MTGEDLLEWEDIREALRQLGFVLDPALKEGYLCEIVNPECMPIRFSSLEGAFGFLKGVEYLSKRNLITRLKNPEAECL